MSSDIQGFSLRFKEILADKGLSGWGRQRFVAKQFGVAHPSAKKWLDGCNYPEIAKLAEIAEWGDTTIDWLITGRGVKHPPSEQLPEDLVKIIDALKDADPKTTETAKNLIFALLGKKSI